MHDGFINDWNKTLSSCDTSALEIMSDDYYVAFFKGVNEQPIIYNRQDAVTGMKQSVEQLLGANKRFENRVIRLKGYEYAIIGGAGPIEFYEKACNAVVIPSLQVVQDR